MITTKTLAPALRAAGFKTSTRNPEWLDLLNEKGHLNLRVVFGETQVELYKFNGLPAALLTWDAKFSTEMPQAPVAELILASV